MNKKEYVKPKIKRIWDVRVSLMVGSSTQTLRFGEDYLIDGENPADAD